MNNMILEDSQGISSPLN